MWGLGADSNRHGYSPADFESAASTIPPSGEPFHIKKRIMPYFPGPVGGSADRDEPPARP